jgi:hypothetical protein
MSQFDASEAPRAGRLRVVRLSYAACLVVLALLTPASGPHPLAQSCGGCPEYCGLSDCSCGQFDCGSYEFCSISGNANPCIYGGGCPPGEAYYGGCCATLGSPILIDLASNGFEMTGMAAGVRFAIGPTELRYQVSWTEPGADDSWLVLDRNGNGSVDGGLEVFGNHTAQPDPPPGQDKNGYLALAVFDRAGQGGNEDGEITSADAIFASLRLWRDANHNGTSEPEELTTLSSAGILSIDLRYRESRRQDEFGNGFRYLSRVSILRNGRVRNTRSVDVYLRVTRNFTN